ncbi:MAG: hypothetical protein EOO57_11110 [Hymenobacter sp.]|nr:MAG: hypothetical protein EOO57_11110 [Hymenobacter sp.]
MAAGIYPDVVAAQKALGSGFAETYTPQPARVADYAARYRQYQAFAQFVESTVDPAGPRADKSEPATRGLTESTVPPTI